MSTVLFPVLMGFMSAGASFNYFWDGDWRKGVYWAAATVITIAVTV